MFNLYLSSEDMIFNNLKTFWAHIKALYKHVLNNTNIIITILSITGKDYLCLYFHPNIIIIKKAAKVQKSEIWNMFTCYEAGKYILISNQKQLELYNVNLITPIFN